MAQNRSQKTQPSVESEIFSKETASEIARRAIKILMAQGQAPMLPLYERAFYAAALEMGSEDVISDLHSKLPPGQGHGCHGRGPGTLEGRHRDLKASLEPSPMGRIGGRDLRPARGQHLYDARTRGNGKETGPASKRGPKTTARDPLRPLDRKPESKGDGRGSFRRVCKMQPIWPADCHHNGRH